MPTYTEITLLQLVALWDAARRVAFEKLRVYPACLGASQWALWFDRVPRVGGLAVNLCDFDLFCVASQAKAACQGAGITSEW